MRRLEGHSAARSLGDGAAPRPGANHTAAHLVTSPASFDSSCSPTRPTTTCSKPGSPVSAHERSARASTDLRQPGAALAYQELVDEHACIYCDLPAEVILKLLNFDAGPRVVANELAEALRNHAQLRVWRTTHTGSQGPEVTREPWATSVSVPVSPLRLVATCSWNTCSLNNCIYTAM